MSNLSSIKELDLFCKMNKKSVVYNRQRILCGFQNDCFYLEVLSGPGVVLLSQPSSAKTLPLLGVGSSMVDDPDTSFPHQDFLVQFKNTWRKLK